MVATSAAALASRVQSEVSVMRVLYGLDRVPQTLSPDDPRLPSVMLGAEPLRLNTVPLPPASWGGGEDHAARMAAMLAWLQAGCGEYNGASRRFMATYLEDVARHVVDHRAVLEEKLAPFAGLYRVEDWCWSALRPLPRAWWLVENIWHRADVAFWDGRCLVSVGRGHRPDLAAFWDGQILPASPFRRILPAGFGGPALRPSSP